MKKISVYNGRDDHTKSYFNCETNYTLASSTSVLLATCRTFGIDTVGDAF